MPDTTAEDIRRVYDTNVFGVVRVTQAFVPLLERSENPVIVNVSSGMGSIGVTSDPEPRRVDDRLARLPVVQGRAEHAHDPVREGAAGMRVNAVDPGYTATDFNDHRGPADRRGGHRRDRGMAKSRPYGPTGTFTDRTGSVPW